MGSMKKNMYLLIFALKTSAYLKTLAAQFFKKTFCLCFFIVFIADVSRESY